MSGVNSFADLLDRCTVDPQTRCWHWKLCESGNGTPSLWFPQLRRRVSLGTVIGTLQMGQEPPPGVYWRVTCKTKNCANPAHRKPGNRSQQMKAAKIKRSAGTRAKISAAKRANSRLTDEVVKIIRDSSETLKTLAARHKISISMASRVRRGELRTDLVSGAASVFTWRP